MHFAAHTSAVALLSVTLACCSEDEKACSVCLAEYEDGDLIRQLLPCRHDFHCKCIDQVGIMTELLLPTELAMA